jgi:hypothetical protein
MLEPFAVLKPARRAAPRPSLRWLRELRRWFEQRGTLTDNGIAAALRIRRETLWHWDKGTKPSPRSIARIVEVTEGEIDPRRPARRPSNAAAITAEIDAENERQRQYLEESWKKLGRLHRKARDQ